MALLKLKDLHTQLEYIDDFEDPKIELEQYITTPHIAGKLSRHLRGIVLKSQLEVVVDKLTSYQ